jgi:acyl carrier protein
MAVGLLAVGFVVMPIATKNKEGINMLSLFKKFLKFLKESRKGNLYETIHLRQPLSAKEFIDLMQNPIYNENLVDIVRKIISKEVIVRYQHKFCYRQIYPSDKLIDDLGLCKIDCLDYASIIIRLESLLGINIPGNEAEEVKTVEDLINLCAKYYFKN